MKCFTSLLLLWIGRVSAGSGDEGTIAVDSSSDLSAAAKEAERKGRPLGLKGLGVNPASLSDELKLTVSKSFSSDCQLVSVDGSSSPCHTGRVTLASSVDELAFALFSTDTATGETQGFSISNSGGGTKYHSISQKRGQILQTIDKSGENFVPPDWSCSANAAAKRREKFEGGRRMTNGQDHHHFHDHSHHEGEHHYHQHDDNVDIGSRLMKEGQRLRGTNRRLGQSHRELYYTDSGNAYTYEVGVYIEVDNVLRNKFATEADMLTYLDNLIAGINIIYEKEVDSHLVIVRVAITTRYDSATNTLGALQIQEAAFGPSGTWPHADADLVHALLGKFLGGGIAYEGVLCNQNFGFGISADLLGTFDINMPQMMVWDIVVTAHEFGHQFDGSHTHEVGAYVGGQVDTCYDDATGLTVPATCPTLIDDSASIMSYCDLCPIGLGVIAPSMGGERTAADTWINSPLVLGTVSTDPFRVPKKMYDHVLDTHTNSACLAKISSEMPSSQPSIAPSGSPSKAPSSTPSITPSNKPSAKPSSLPSSTPSTKDVSSMPSSTPSLTPTGKPSAEDVSPVPSSTPSVSPSDKPSATDASSKPSSTPSVSPSDKPSATNASSKPSSTPSVSPSDKPSATDASSKPSSTPSVSPSDKPSATPVPPSATPVPPSATPVPPSATPVPPTIAPQTPTTAPSLPPTAICQDSDTFPNDCEYESGPYNLEVNVSSPPLTTDKLEEDMCQALKEDPSWEVLSCCVAANLVQNNRTFSSFDISTTLVYKGTCGTSDGDDDRFEEILTSDDFQAKIGGKVVSLQPVVSSGTKSSKSASKTGSKTGGSKSSKSGTKGTGGSKTKRGTGGSKTKRGTGGSKSKMP